MILFKSLDNERQLILLSNNANSEVHLTKVETAPYEYWYNRIVVQPNIPLTEYLTKYQLNTLASSKRQPKVVNRLLIIHWKLFKMTLRMVRTSSEFSSKY